MTLEGCVAWLDAFYERYGCYPTRVRLPRHCVARLCWQAGLRRPRGRERLVIFGIPVEARRRGDVVPRAALLDDDH